MLLSRERKARLCPSRPFPGFDRMGRRLSSRAFSEFSHQPAPLLLSSVSYKLVPKVTENHPRPRTNQPPCRPRHLLTWSAMGSGLPALRGLWGCATWGAWGDQAPLLDPRLPSQRPSARTARRGLAGRRCEPEPVSTWAAPSLIT